MRDQVRSAVATLKAVARELDPAVLDGQDALGLFEDAAEAERLCAAIKALSARRVDETGVWRRSGKRTAAHFVADKTGVSIAAASNLLETAESLDALPVTSDAFRAGKLSEVQANEIAGAASLDPTRESHLVDVAKRSHLKGLKDRCRDVRASAVTDDAAWAARLHSSRSLTRWTDRDGARCGQYRVAPEVGARLDAAIDGHLERIFRDARSQGSREGRDAYAADALVALAEHGPAKPIQLHVLVDDTALARGRVAVGERCEIPGVGPIPVTTAKAMLAGNAKIRQVPREGTALPDYASEGRYLPPWLKAWLDARYPVCGADGCDADFRLQYDHVVAIEDGGLTEQANLWRLCPYHHDAKTNRGWRVIGTTHDWNLVQPGAPDDPDPP